MSDAKRYWSRLFQLLEKFPVLHQRSLACSVAVVLPLKHPLSYPLIFLTLPSNT